MRRILVIVALVAGTVTGLACNGNDDDPPEATLDCEDFEDRNQAQRAYEQARDPGGEGIDPHGLDEDGDGRACEDLPAPERGETDD